MKICVVDILLTDYTVRIGDLTAQVAEIVAGVLEKIVSESTKSVRKHRRMRWCIANIGGTGMSVVGARHQR